MWKVILYSSKNIFSWEKDKNVQKGQASHILSEDPCQFPCNTHICLCLTFSPHIFPSQSCLSFVIFSTWFGEGL